MHNTGGVELRQLPQHRAQEANGVRGGPTPLQQQIEGRSRNELHHQIGLTLLAPNVINIRNKREEGGILAQDVNFPLHLALLRLGERAYQLNRHRAVQQAISRFINNRKTTTRQLTQQTVALT